jgi:hypothetical protein
MNADPAWIEEVREGNAEVEKIAQRLVMRTFKETTPEEN